MLKCYIEGKNNNEEYRITDGAVFIENYNETLDSATIIIPQLPNKIDISPYDIVIVTGDNIQTKRMCVDSYVCTQECLDPAIYRYEITLFSETKLLEGIVCPSLSITKRLNGAPVSIGTYVKHYLDLFSPKVYNGSNDYETYQNKYTMSNRLNWMYNVPCPEMQWNEPTLREVLTDLMMVRDCIPVVHNNVIDYIDIGMDRSEITDEQKKGINYITESQSSADYVSEIKMHLQNAANNSNDVTALDTTEVIEYIGFRNDESYLLTSDNIRLQTSFPIWKIFYCKANAPIKVKYYLRNLDTNHIELFEQEVYVDRVLKDDNVDFILEYGLWKTKDVYYKPFSWGELDLDSNYRNRCLFYVRGSQNIDNFCEYVKSEFLWIENTQYVANMIFSKSDIARVAEEAAIREVQRLKEQFGENWEVVSSSGPDSEIDWKTILFELKYEALDDCVFTATKSPMRVNKRTIVDNQTNSYIDINRQGILEYFKANRLGNKIVLVNGRYETHEDALPKLSYKINNKIIFQKQIKVYENFIDVNYQCTENYVLKDYFTGVKSKLRSWAILEGDNALVRSEHLKFYLNDKIYGYSSPDKLIPKYETLDEYLENFKYCAIQFYSEKNVRFPQDTLIIIKEKPGINMIPGAGGVTADYSIMYTLPTNAIMVEFTKHKIANKSVIFTIKLSDNANVGNYIYKWAGTGGSEQKGVKYVDDNGEVKRAVIYFFNKFKWDGMIEGLENYEEANQCARPLVRIDETPNENSNGFPYNLNNMKGIDMVAKIPVLLWKDNKEILQISIQFELNDEADNLYLGKVNE